MLVHSLQYEKLVDLGRTPQMLHRPSAAARGGTGDLVCPSGDEAAAGGSAGDVGDAGIGGRSALISRAHRSRSARRAVTPSLPIAARRTCTPPGPTLFRIVLHVVQYKSRFDEVARRVRQILQMHSTPSSSSSSAVGANSNRNAKLRSSVSKISKLSARSVIL